MGAGKAYSGESARDRAGNKMDKQLARLARHARPQRNETLLEQIQRQYPDTWRLVVAEMKRERDEPGYAEKKAAAEADFRKRYYTEVPPYERGTTTELAWVNKRMQQWVREENPDAA